MGYASLGTFSSSGAGGVPLYSFTTATFTSGGQSGRLGPSLTQARSGLTGSGVDSWKNDTSFFNTSNGIQLWTVPETKNYRITAIGARGGTAYTGYGGGDPGRGARMVSTISLEKGQVIKILVGQRGIDGNSGNSCGQDGGGGGGTFVATSSNSPLIVAGGGGGAGNHTRDSAGARHSPNSQSGNKGSGTTSGNGGTGGDGGFVQSGSCVTGGASGAGFTGNGRTNGQSTASQSFTNGGNGGAGGARDGGFGGGGASGTNYAAGGGGGYSGGGGGGLETCFCNDMGNGGGGGCYSITTFTYTAQIGTDHGSVLIEKL